MEQILEMPTLELPKFSDLEFPKFQDNPWAVNKVNNSQEE